ncbi:MAG: MTAP family purine nucleoside phosphorylase [Anaerolineaceae bacterium]|nr:MTAP family purine nucleoside phosphorylase [Anaerolineaceae bacterium]
MKSAIITGTGIYEIAGHTFKPETVETLYGPAQVFLSQDPRLDLVFLARHGVQHTTPPHMVNYRANFKALQMLGVKQALAAYAVGSINREIPPLGMALLTDFLDFTCNRPLSFYDGAESGLAHTSMDQPYCPTLGSKLLELAPEFDLNIRKEAVYVATNGPRFETPAEIRMYSKLGGDVVGMTGVPEAVLAKELGIHFAAVAVSINWASGIEETMTIVEGNRGDLNKRLTDLFLRTLSQEKDFPCRCETAAMITHPPKSGTHNDTERRLG